MSFVCSRISEQPTAFIFWVTKLIQVDAQVRQVTNVHCLEVLRESGQSQLQRVQGWMGLVPSHGSSEFQEQTFQHLNKWDYVKTAQILGREWQHKIHLLHVGVGTEGKQCCTRAVRLFCSREHLAAQILASVVNIQQIFFHCIKLQHPPGPIQSAYRWSSMFLQNTETKLTK